MNLTAIDIFSGCGGATSGLINAGFSVLTGVELDEAPAVAYQMNFPDIHLFQMDVRQLRAADIMKRFDLKAGDLDLVTGCSPCQGFSRMRTRNRKDAVEDDRNDLVLDFVRLVKGLLPKTIIFENVPGLIHNYRFNDMKRRLEELDFLLAHKVINLADYGIPQRRRRLILIGSRLGPPSLPETKGSKLTVRSAIGSLPRPEESDDPIHRSVAVHSESVMDRIRRIPKDGGSRMDLGLDAQLA